MPLTADIEQSIFALPADERYALADRLLDSVDDELPGCMYPEEILEEANRRDEGTG